MHEQIYCTRCGAKCKGTLLIELRKGSEPKPFCTNCFAELEMIPKMAEVKKEIAKYH